MQSNKFSKASNRVSKFKQEEIFINNTIKNKYVCPNCDTEYSTKHNFKNHLLNKKSCIKQQQLNEVMKQTEQDFLIKKENT